MWYKIFGNGVHNGMKKNVTLKISTEEITDIIRIQNSFEWIH